MTDTLTRIDDLERRVFRVERHLGLATPPVRWPAVLPAPSVRESAEHDWMEAITESSAREQSHARARREVLDQYLRRDAAIVPAPAPAPVSVAAPSVAAKLQSPRPMAPPPLPPLPPRA